jgi:hypothetical protein
MPILSAEGQAGQVVVLIQKKELAEDLARPQKQEMLVRVPAAEICICPI